MKRVSQHLQESFLQADEETLIQSCPLEESYILHKCPFLVSLLCVAIDYEEPVGFSDGSQRATAGDHQNIKAACHSKRSE